jgi:hypothetical protein
MPVNIVDIPMPNFFTQGIGILPPSEKKNMWQCLLCLMCGVADR